MVSRRFREPELCGFDSRLPDRGGLLGLCSLVDAPSGAAGPNPATPLDLSSAALVLC